uniref:Ankyrin repeat protein n=1 Tax=Pithovirus LCPAC103 TaxID=2506588 RepID=A0A481Z3I4_9VIRU|nr:MAG: ankyrin repeat protein [Pithovirus LCPAC103]
MEAAEISVYSLSEILTMNEGWLPRFLERLAIPESDDALGQIVLALASLGKLTYLPPINSDNLRGLINITKPAEISRTKEVVRSAGVTPSTNRLELMKQYLSYAMVPLAESPRFLPVVRPTSPRLSIARPTSPRTSVPIATVFEAIPEAQRGEFVALVNLLNTFPGETIQQIVKNYSYRRIQKICEIIATVLIYGKFVRVSSVLMNKLRNLNELLCNSQFFWHLKTQHDFGVTYDTPPDRRTWKQDYEFLLSAYLLTLQRSLIIAVENRNILEIKALLDFGVDPNGRGEGYPPEELTRQRTPIEIAVRLNEPNIVRLLLTAGADPNIYSKRSRSPISVAVGSGYIEIVRVLLPHSNLRSKAEALSHAASSGRIDMVGLLLAAGVDISKASQALTLASRIGHIDIVRLLLAAGVNPNVYISERTENALTAAIDEGHIEIVRLLLASGADPNISDDFQGTALTAILFMTNIDARYVEIIRLLLAAGADPNIPNKYGKSAVQLARLRFRDGEKEIDREIYELLTS